MNSPDENVEAENRQDRRRVLIVGLDGATFDVILPMVESRRLPNLASLMKTGAWGDLESTRPPLSPAAWSSFVTGKNPGKHGVFGFEEIVPNTYDFRPVAADRAGHASLWRILSEHGRKVVAIDIPFSYPPEPVNGCLISGYGTPVGEGIEFTYPASLRADLADRFGDCEVAVPRMKAAPPRDAVFEKWDHILGNRRRIADHLMRTVDWDVFMIVLGVTDHIQHGAWTYYEPLHPDSQKPDAERFRDVLFKYYEKADEFLGMLIENAGEPLHVIVASDHGFGTTWRGDLTRRVLEEAEFLCYRGIAGGRHVMGFLHEVYHRMPGLKRFLHSRPGDRARLKRAVAGAIDWSKTAAFQSTMGWQVYVNRQGDFPKGRVKPGYDYDRVCGKIKAKLEIVTAPGTRRRVVRRVWRREKIYSGEMTARAPDLTIEYENLHGAHAVSGPSGWDLVGSHTMNGVLIASGPDIRSTHLNGARIIDVAPTVLYLLGLPVPADMDGHVLEDSLRPDALAGRKAESGSVPASTEGPAERPRERPPEEDELVREQLRNLGYID